MSTASDEINKKLKKKTKNEIDRVFSFSVGHIVLLAACIAITVLTDKMVTGYMAGVYAGYIWIVLSILYTVIKYLKYKA